MVRSSDGRSFQRRGALTDYGYDSVGEHEMRSDRGWSADEQTGLSDAIF